ncbi:MAG: hypothetical protein ACOY33_12465 [Pseudomonadota bacterium]
MAMRIARLLVTGLLLSIWMSTAQARITIDPLTYTATVNWTGGDVVQQWNFCTESIAEAFPPGTTVLPYDVNVNIGGTAQAYALWAGGVGPGVAVDVGWRDLLAGTAYTLSPNVATARVMTGNSSTGCPGNDNGRITLRVLDANLRSLAPGSYTRSFNVVVTNAGAGRKTHSATVTLTINIPTVARISQLNDIPLGTWSGVGNMTGSDTLCIYRNSAGLYSITATGSGAGGAFTLANGAATIPYAATWNDGTGAAALTTGVALANRTNAWTAGDGCNGGVSNNATVAVTVTAASLAAAAATGAYTGVLTLTYRTQ